jgi:hypothetical protein
MVGWMDSDGVRVAGYLAVALASVVAGLREHRRARSHPALWPTFWYLTALLFAALAGARAGHVAELIADVGREQAAAAGWYAHRRQYQALAVGSVAMVWFIVIAVSLWRVPERRRRYLPMALVSFTIVCYAGIRMVSLHQIDSLLYRTYIRNTKVGAVIEVTLLVAALLLVFWHPRARSRSTGLSQSGRTSPQAIGRS